MPTTSFRIPNGLKNDLDAIVHARSSPDSDINRTDVLIEALEDYVDEHSDEVEDGWKKSGQTLGTAESHLAEL